MMTTEKAIHLLHRLQDEQFDGLHGDERREALEMAVRALESNLVKESDGLVNDLVKDCISRKMAIDALNDEYHGMISDESMKIYQIINWISALPPAQPTQTNADSTQTNALDCVSRQEAIDAINNCYCGGEDSCGEPWIYEDDAIKAVEQLPSAQPEEVVPHKNYKYLSDYWCECGWHLGKKGDVKYCSDCGRKVKWNG